MLTAATRPYTPAELDEYADRMLTGRAYAVTLIVVGALFLGACAFLLAAAVHALYAWLTPATFSWTIALVLGGAATLLTIFILCFVPGPKDWADQPPQRATDVTATAYAAWIIASDGLDRHLVLRVEADCYLIITRNALTPPILHATEPDVFGDTIPSNIRLLLLGEGPFRIALKASLAGLAIPLTHVEAKPDPDNPDDETPIPDGLYTTRELPQMVQRALGVA